MTGTLPICGPQGGSMANKPLSEFPPACQWSAGTSVWPHPGENQSQGSLFDAVPKVQAPGTQRVKKSNLEKIPAHRVTVLSLEYRGFIDPWGYK